MGSALNLGLNPESMYAFPRHSGLNPESMYAFPRHSGLDPESGLVYPVIPDQIRNLGSFIPSFRTRSGI